MAVARDQQVVEHRDARRERDVLEGSRDPERGDPVRAQLRELVAAVADRAGAGRIDPAQHVQARRLAGAVGPDQRVQGAGLDREGHVATAPRARRSARTTPRPRASTRSSRRAAPASTGGTPWPRRGSALAPPRSRPARRPCPRAPPAPPPGRPRGRQSAAPSPRSARPPAGVPLGLELADEIEEPARRSSAPAPARARREAEAWAADISDRAQWPASAARHQKACRLLCPVSLGEDREQCVDPGPRLLAGPLVRCGQAAGEGSPPP